MSFNYDHKSIQMRRGTSAEWREYGDKCVPLEAELCVELMQYPDGTINKSVGVKVGNGIDSYEQLPYVILNEEVDPIFTSHPAYEITQEMIDMWNQASIEPGDEYGQVTRWDGTEWVPSSIILLKDVEGVEVHRNVLPFRGSALDIGAADLTFKAGYFDSLDTGTINVDGSATIGGDISVDGSINIDGNIIGGEGGINIGNELDLITENIGSLEQDLEDEIQNRIDGDTLLQQNIDALGTNLAEEIEDRKDADSALQDEIDELEAGLAQEVTDRQDGDTALGSRIDNLATDDLTDVNSAGAKLDQFLIHNGTQWVAEDFHIDTELTFKGGISVPNDAAPTSSNGDLYINNEDGVAGASWTGIAGKNVNAANAVGWSELNSRWYLLGDIASASVIRVEAGEGIDVDDTKAAEPVVSVDRTEVDKWYEPTIDPKRSAFNKNFGTSAGTVAEGDHNHDGDYATVDHDHNGVYEPVFAKNSAFNKNFGQQAGDVAQGNHTHSQYITDETDPTVPQHVKNITTTQISNWDTAFGWGNHAAQGYLKAGDVPGADLTGYATEVWVSTNYQPKGSYLTSADLNGYATQSWVTSQGYLTSASLSGYATESWVSTNYQPKGSYALVGASYTKAESDGRYELKGEGGGGLPAGDWACNGSITATGNITAYYASDERLKDDITAMPVGLIDSIEPVTWKWKEGGKDSGGVVAQQLQACGLDDWVNEAPNGDLGVDYNALIGMLIAEVKSLKAEVEALKS